jgi:hypothetical protein
MLQKIYNSESSAIASYDYFDIADGTGMKMFYLASVYGNYILTINQIYAETVEYNTGAQALTTSFAKIMDVDYDLSQFNFPQQIGGSAVCSFSFFGFKSGTATTTCKITVKVRKYSGTTETELGEATTDELLNTTAAYKTTSLVVPVANTSFKAGDILRVTIEGWAKEAAADSTIELGIGQDPMNRDATRLKPSTDNPVSTTTTKIWMPFKIDL